MKTNLRKSISLVLIVLSAGLSTQSSCSHEIEIEQLDEFNAQFARLIDTIALISDDWLVEAGNFNANLTEFNVTAGEYLEAFKDMYDRLPEQARIVIDDLEYMLNDVVTLASANANCLENILLYRMEGALNLVNFNYNFDPSGSSFDPGQMAVCPANVWSVDLSAPNNNWDEIKIHGYRLPDPSKLRIQLIDEAGDPILIDDEIGLFNRNGDFALTVNLQASPLCTSDILQYYKQLVIGVKDISGEIIPLIELPIRK